MGDDLIPLSLTGLSHTLTPLVSDREPILPIGKFERLVKRDVLRHTLLHGSTAFQTELLFFCVVADEVGHEFGSGLYLLVVFFEGLFRGGRTEHLLGQIDVMGLLPDKERTGV